jgi:hypothetical protein
VPRNPSFFGRSNLERFPTSFGMTIKGTFPETVRGGDTISRLCYLQTRTPLIFVAYRAGFDIVIALLS